MFFWADNYVMDPESFKQKLEQFAELKQMKVPRSAGIREADEPEVIERHGVSMTLESDNNPTIGWCIKNLKTVEEQCNDCGDSVKNRIVQHKLYFSPRKHWRENCKNCQMIRDPYTEEFTLTVTRSYQVFAAFLDGKECPREYTSKEESISRVVHKKPTK